ncbi:hypothetical protein GC167_09655 [bacterium]|nr:hypothetical protein [bacterium]
MKKLLLLSALVLAFSCSKDDNNDNPNTQPTIALADVIDGYWNVTGIQRIDEGNVQGSPYYLDYVMDTVGVYFDFDTTARELDFWQYYIGTDAASGTSVNTNDEFFDVPFQITGNNTVDLYALGDTVTMTATSIQQDAVTLRSILEFTFPGFYEKQTLTINLTR